MMLMMMLIDDVDDAHLPMFGSASVNFCLWGIAKNSSEYSYNVVNILATSGQQGLWHK